MMKPTESGYRPCAVPECMEIAIGQAGAICQDCEESPQLSWDYSLQLRGDETDHTGRVMGEDIRAAFEAACEDVGCAGIDVALFHVAEGD